MRLLPSGRVAPAQTAARRGPERGWRAGGSYKEVYEGLGYKKMSESLKAIPDVVHVDGENIKLKGKK